MGSYKNYMPKPLKTLSLQVAQGGVFVTFILTVLVTLGCSTRPLSSLYTIRFLVGDQRPSQYRNDTITGTTYEWHRVGISGVCTVNSSSSSPSSQTQTQTHCGTQQRHPFYYEPREIYNTPSNMDALLQKSGVACSVLYILAVWVWGLAGAATVASLVAYLYNKSFAKYRLFQNCAKGLVVAGCWVLLAAACLMSAVYAMYFKLLRSYDASHIAGDKFHQGTRQQFQFQNPVLNYPQHFQPKLGAAAFALAWLAVLSALVSTLAWIKVHFYR